MFELAVKSSKMAESQNAFPPSEKAVSQTWKVKTQKDSIEGRPFEHPVFKKLSQLNGEINKMTKDEIKTKLESLRMDTRGVKEVLKKRLKGYYRRTKTKKAGVRQPQSLPQHDYLLVIDYEATCQETNGPDWLHEIIEFPVVLVNSETREVEDTFHSFVKPVLNPKLSPFCSSLTGIQQADVDTSPTFPVVLQLMEEWMDKHGLGREKTAVALTDGPWDMGRFLYLQCHISQVPIPPWATRWINLRKAYCTFYNIKKVNLVSMLDNLGLAFKGHQHSGLDDSRNIARIALHMLHDGCDLHINERLLSHKLHQVECKNYPRSQIVPVRPNEKLEDESDSVSGEGNSSSVVESSASAAQTEALDGRLCSQVADLTLESKNLLTEADDVDDLLSYYALQCKR